MARTPRNTIFEAPQSEFWDIGVATASGYYTVVYDDQAIKVFRNHRLIDKTLYVRTGFPEPGHAENLADKLNAKFNTDKFTVRKLL